MSTRPTPVPGPTNVESFADAIARKDKEAREYAAQVALGRVINRYLLLVILGLVVAVVVVGALAAVAVKKVNELHLVAVRINEVGKAVPVNLDKWEYTPQAEECKYFLSEFVRLYYTRQPELLQRNFDRSLMFLNDNYRRQVVHAWDTQKVISDYLQGGSTSPLIDVEVISVSIDQLQTAPYEAHVEFYEIFMGNSTIDRPEKKRIRYRANFTFAFAARPSDKQLKGGNPLGLEISHFREDAVLD